MQFQQIAALLSVVLTAISAVGGADISAFTPVLQKISAVVGGLGSLQSPTSLSADVADITALLSTLKSSGVIATSGPLDEALAALGKFTATVADYKRGDLAIIDDNFSFDGVPGILCAMTKGGNAAQLHGM
jgi:hypothetical protein